MMLTSKRQKRCHPITGQHVNTPPVASIAPVWSAFGRKFLTAETYTAVATLSTAYEYGCLVNKHSDKNGHRVDAREFPTGVSIRSRFFGVDMNLPTLEPNRSVRQSEERVISAHTHQVSRLKRGSTLANNDVPNLHALTAKALDTAILWVGVASVSCAALSLFVCHRATFKPRGKNSVYGL